MIDTSAEGLLKLAVDLDTIGPDHVMRVPTHQSAAVLLRSAATLRALAAERTAAAPDVVERARVAISDALHAKHGLPPVVDHSEGSNADAFREHAAAALSALRPGDEVPAGVVVPGEMTEEMIEAASHAGLKARDLIRDKHPHRRGFADAEWLPASWRAALSAIKGGEDE